MARLDVLMLQCDRCKYITSEPNEMSEFMTLKSDTGVTGETFDICGDCWTWFKQRFMTKIGSLPVEPGGPIPSGSVTAKVRVTGKGPVMNRQVALSLNADYLDERNHEWAYYNPTLGINMTVKESVANLFGVNQTFTLVFIPEEG